MKHRTKHRSEPELNKDLLSYCLVPSRITHIISDVNINHSKATRLINNFIEKGYVAVSMVKIKGGNTSKLYYTTELGRRFLGGNYRC